MYSLKLVLLSHVSCFRKDSWTVIIVVGGPCSSLCRDVTVFVCVFQLVFQSEMLDKLIAVGGAMLFSLS